MRVPSRSSSAALAAIAFAAHSLAAGDMPLDVPHIDTVPEIDGELSEPAWQTALLVDDFVARFPVEGANPSLKTEVRLVHTNRALYLALRAFDPDPQSLRLTSMRRDDFAVTEGDQFVIAIDSFHDRRNGYWFSTNPLGVRVDAQFSDEGDRFEDSWNGVWNAAARIDDQGWTAELEIPWATLRFREGDEVVMGINLFRRIPRSNEQIFAPAIPLIYRYGTPNVSAARPYRFRNISGGFRVDLRPFVLVTAVRGDAGDGNDDFDGGLFVRVPISDAVTFAGTSRADFSEVEADETQLNLTRFPLFLPEKRDFFLEGAGFFTFGAQGEAELFFSRTIGFVIDDEGRAVTVPVKWGGKGTGRIGRVEFGALSAASEDAPGAPGEQFHVARGRLSLGSRSYLGGFWSRRSGREPSSQTTMGADVSHFFAHEVRWQAFAARDEFGEKRSDAWFAALTRGGDRASFTLSALDLDPNFAPAVGLVARPGTRRLEASGALPWFPAGAALVRRYVPSLSWIRYDDKVGDGFDERFAFGLEIASKTDHRIRGELVRQNELVTRPFTIYRDFVIPAGTYNRWEGVAGVTSNPARPVSAQAELRVGGLYGGDHWFGGVGLSWRPSRFLVLAPTVLTDRVDLPQGQFTAWVALTRVGLTVSPRLRFDLLGQYQSEVRSLGGGLRARYDFREGTQVVFAWDSIELRDPLRAPGEPERRHEDQAAFKFSYLLLF